MDSEHSVELIGSAFKLTGVVVLVIGSTNVEGHQRVLPDQSAQVLAQQQRDKRSDDSP